MKKFLSLLKATTKGELTVFRMKNEKKNSKSSIILIAFLSLIVMASAYAYADMFGSPLHELNLTYILLTLFSLAMVILNIFEGIYKSQGIIFDAKDNNLLFSLPVKKTHILTVRIIKLLVFDYLFELLFMVPCFIKYIQFEPTNIAFYLISVLYLILLPLLPLVISCIIGYLIKSVSTVFKNKKLIQTVISLALFFGIYGLSFNLEGFVNNVAAKATSINDLITRIYLPIGLYIDLIQKFDIVKLLELILVSILPFILFIFIFQFKYESIINVSKESGSGKKNKKVIIKSTSMLKSLTKKELKTYFSIPVYVINTIIGPIMALLASIMLIIKYDMVIKALSGDEFGLSTEQITANAPYLVIIVIMVLTAMTSITSSSISLEGKKINIIKSLPIKPYDLFMSKILTSDLLIIPFMLISAIIMIIKLQIFNYNIIFILLTCTVVPHLIAEIGLLANLKYPKLNYNSEVEVVKQSIAVLVSLFIGIILSVATIFSFEPLSSIIGHLPTLLLYSIIFIGLTIFLNKLLKTYGTKKFNEL